MVTLIIGGARSGKSRFAQSLAADSDKVTYVATYRSDDDAEMLDRIALHRSHRPAHWTTIEEPLDLARTVEDVAGKFDLVIVDCLTVWLSNVCYAHRDSTEAEIKACAVRQLSRMIAAAPAGRVVLVTNEVGCGLVPETALGRMFRDVQGYVNQEAARAADWVYHLVAGIPVPIKRPEVRL